MRIGISFIIAGIYSCVVIKTALQQTDLTAVAYSTLGLGLGLILSIVATATIIL